MLCERCGQAEAEVTLTRIVMDGGETAVESRHLCGACARAERIAEVGAPPESGPSGAERFRPLHAHALQLLARLEATFQVTRSQALPSSPGSLIPLAGLETLRSKSELPPVLLTPRRPDAASLAIVFTAGPGLVVRCGRWYEAMFGAPFHTHDVMWMTAAHEAERLDDLVGKVVDGLFAEAVRLPLVGGARMSFTFGDGTPRLGLSGESLARIPRAHARTLIGSGPRAVRWSPWPRR